MSQRDGHEWTPIPLSHDVECCESGCQKLAIWNKVLIACDKSSCDGGNYCHQHAEEDRNLMAKTRNFSEIQTADLKESLEKTTLPAWVVTGIRQWAWNTGHSCGQLVVDRYVQEWLHRFEELQKNAGAR